jgi:hypothetical protein
LGIWNAVPLTRGFAIIATPSVSTAGRTMQETVYSQRVQPQRLPADAPNILIVLIYDTGPGLRLAYGGDVRNGHADPYPGRGYRVQPFPHDGDVLGDAGVAADRSPSAPHRQAQIAEFANDWDGYAGEIPKNSSLAAEVLNDYGYATDTDAVDASKQPENGHM